jgi:cell division protein ZapA
LDELPDFDAGSRESTEAVKVRLFGREYSIRGHGNRTYVKKLAEFINERGEEIQRRTAVVSTLDVVILTLLNISDEMFRCKQNRERTLKELEEKTDKLLKTIDRVV